MNAEVRHFAAAVDRLPAISEHDADTAFLHLSKLRDRLVHANENIAACRVDEAIEKLQAACRELLARPDPARWAELNAEWSAPTEPFDAFRDCPVGRDLQIVEVK